MCARRGRPTVCERQEQPGFTMMGSFAEFLALPRADRNLSAIPPKVSFVEAAALGCRFTTAYRAVVQQGGLGIKSEEEARGTTVAVFGCGGLRLSCVMIAKAFGAGRIVAVDVSDDALAKAREVGATDVVNAKRANVRQQVMDLTDGAGSDVTVDAAGFKATCEDAVHCARRGGRMVQVGLPVGGPDPIVPMAAVAGKELEIVGSHGCAAEDIPAILSLVEDGRLDPKKLIGREVTLEEGARALMDMDRGSPIGMVMVTKFTEMPASRY
ncbi:hypothetical protein ACHAWF_005824 [Thalassiosira exigua]